MTQNWGGGNQQSGGTTPPGWNHPSRAWGPPVEASRYVPPTTDQALPAATDAQYPGDSQQPAAPQPVYGQQYPRLGIGQQYPPPAAGQHSPAGTRYISADGGSAGYPPSGYPTAPFYGPGQYPPPGQFTPPPRRRRPLGSFIMLVVFLGLAGLFVISILNYLGDGLADSASEPTSTTATTVATPASNTTEVAQPDYNPPEVPAPRTYSQAKTWVEKNAVYSRSITVPTSCQVARIDVATATTKQLQAHLNNLTACLVLVWNKPLAAAGFELPRPPVTVYSSSVTTECGKISGINASYCAADQRIYYSKQLYQIFPKSQQSTPFLTETIMAHEFGHAVQARSGILVSSQALENQAATTAKANIVSRRKEVQADCFAGMFTEAVAQSSGLTSTNLSDLRDVMFTLGDDVGTGDDNIDGDHGLGSTRKSWFTTGQENTLIGACNTYTVAASKVR